jgi:N-methylhydantoinase A
MAWRFGIDIGGTFTDVAMAEEDAGRIAIAKLPTTPRDFGQAVVDGIRQGLDANRIDPADVSLLSHATTVVTNALLENKGARAGFITTRGMRDILELRRSSRADLYDLLQDAPAVLIPRRWRFEITKRVDAQGEVSSQAARCRGSSAGCSYAAGLDAKAIRCRSPILRNSELTCWPFLTSTNGSGRSVPWPRRCNRTNSKAARTSMIRSSPSIP